MVTLVWSSFAFCGDIHDAAKAGDLEKVKALLKGNPELVCSQDNTPIGLMPLHWAASEGHKAVAELRLTNKADVNAKDNFGMTPLHWAALLAQKAVVELRLTNKAEVNAKANNGSTPLHLAALWNHKDLAELLLANKAEVNAKDGQGCTPLDAAVFKGRTDVARLLRQHGGQAPRTQRDRI